MHHLVELYLSWSGTLHIWARSAVEILLWFWVVSGAIFVLRFLAFMLPENGDTSASDPEATTSNAHVSTS
jgi:hypothetical protein